MSYFQLEENEKEDNELKTNYPKKRINKVKLLTYNLFMRPPFIKNNENDFKNERLSDFYGYFENYDILCLQEIFGYLSKRKNKLIKKAVKKGYYFAESSTPSTFLSFFLIDGGLLTLSRYFLSFINFKSI